MIFYFTGTGNSLYVAKKLDNEYISIPQIMHSEKLEFTSAKIGIVCPIYGHEMPAMVKEFLRKAKFHTEYMYIILTYGKRHANAVELAGKTLQDIGIKADYITTMLMVDNFLPVFDMNEEMKLDKKIPQQFYKIKTDIASKKKEYQEVTDKDRSAHKEYLKMVNGASEDVWANFDFTDGCIGCGICAKVCPAGCIHIENQRAVRRGENCQACYACIHACHKNAIKMKKTFGFQEKNPKARYRNEHVALAELTAANNQD